MTERLIRIHLPGILLVFALLIGLLIYFVVPPARVARTAFFPGTATDALSGERRLVPRTPDVEREIEILLEEVLLGPSDINHRPIVPRGTSARSVMIRDDAAYIDLTGDALVEASAAHAQIQLAMDALERTLTYNYRNITRVEITIDGSVPFAPGVRLIGR